MREVTLIGLDFGSTTSSAAVARATLRASAATGRVEIAALREVLRSEMVFTPRRGDALDIDAIDRLLEGWLRTAEIALDDIAGGGAIVTGLAATAPNAGDLTALLQRRVRGALIAAANDPRHEAWLAFMGYARARSRASPDTVFANLDIGGGTASVALGKAGEVTATASLFAGARHVRVAPGTYRITALSPVAQALFTALGIHKGPSDSLSPAEVSAVVGLMARAIEAVIQGDRAFFASRLGAPLRDAELRPSPHEPPQTITLSGGVGELYHRLERGDSLPLTPYGDLGVDLAARLLHEPWLTGKVPSAMRDPGRATAFGLLLHATQLAGSTVYLPHPERLPLRDVPILGVIKGSSPTSHLRDVVHRAAESPRGAALRVALEGPLKRAAEELIEALEPHLDEAHFSADRPLVLLVSEDVGKFLGQGLTRWGSRPRALIVLDRVSVPEAQFLHIGEPREGLVPISLYGM